MAPPPDGWHAFCIFVRKLDGITWLVNPIPGMFCAFSRRVVAIIKQHFTMQVGRKCWRRTRACLLHAMAKHLPTWSRSKDLSHPLAGESDFRLCLSPRNDPGLSAGTAWDRSQDRSHPRPGESSKVIVFFQSNRPGTGTHRLAFYNIKRTGQDRPSRHQGHAHGRPPSRRAHIVPGTRRQTGHEPHMLFSLRT